MPWFKFHPNDYLSDPAVMGVSLAAQGLWVRMLCLMHGAPRYGYLLTPAETPMPVTALSRACGCDISVTEALLKELEEMGVFSKNSDGAIFSRRMVRDAEIRDKGAKRQARYRDVTPMSRRCNADVTGKKQKQREKSEAEGEADVSVEQKTETIPPHILFEGDGSNVPPTEEQVVAYMKRVGGMSDDECLKFWDHHQTRGWKLKGGVAMKDWKSACRTWRSNLDKFNGQKLPVAEAL